MNKEKILKLIDPSVNIQWRVEASNENTILFYKFNKKNSQERDQFLKRIKDQKFRACIVNDELKSENCYPVSDLEFKELKSDLLKSLYPLQSSLKFIGVTGTNGKTTTVDIIRQASILNNKNVLTFGTIGCYHNDSIAADFKLTTPNLIDAHKLIFKLQKNLNLVAFELSSHALEQSRLGHFQFDAIGWTNFTQDHLDYHKTMESYFRAKCRAIELLKNKDMIFLSHSLSKKELNFPFKYKVSREQQEGTHPFFKLSFNKENLSMAYTLLESVFSEIDKQTSSLVPPPGRFDVITHGNSYIAIDYAHTPDALASICREIKVNFPDHRLKVLFGCGGDRDPGKRALMGEAVSSYANYVFVTSDNPRFERPGKIIEDILQGISIPYEVDESRVSAIEKALLSLDKDILLIAGKGHENYIDIMGERIFHDDRLFVKDFLVGRK